MQIIVDRYDGYFRDVFNIAKAASVDGMMSHGELAWLSRSAQKTRVIIEVGSWAGRSARALADNMPDNAVLYAIDTFDGSADEKDSGMRVAREMDGDHVCFSFTKNLWDHIEKGRVHPIRMNGRNAARLLREQGVKANLIFIDAGHMYEEVKEDIQNFLPLLSKDGVICGHDFNQPVWPDVTRAVLEELPQAECAPGTTIWFIHSLHASVQRE
jgi:predicted O-methyltransferase YrrM